MESTPPNGCLQMAMPIDEAVAVSKACAPSMLRHLEIASESQSVPAKLPRTLSDARSTFGPASYSESLEICKFARNCHVGQRKLCVALIEFLTEVHHAQITRRGVSSPVLVVYAGASIVAALAALDLFPTDRFVCYDPSVEMTVNVARRGLGHDGARVIDARTTIATSHLTAVEAAKSLENKPILLFTGPSQGVFKDSTCTYILHVAKACAPLELVFVSDIRRSIGPGAGKELAIAEDMVNQARWAKFLGVAFYCLKFRLPFELTDDIRVEYTRLRDISCDKITPDSIPYFDGLCIIQKYAPEYSTELRLVGLHEPKLVTYNIKDVESICAPFNVVHRGHSRFLPYTAMTESGPNRIPSWVVLAQVKAIQALSGCTGLFDAMGECCVIRDAVLVGNAESGSKEYAVACSRFCSMFASRPCKRGQSKPTYAAWVVLNSCFENANGHIKHPEGARHKQDRDGSKSRMCARASMARSVATIRASH